MLLFSNKMQFSVIDSKNYFFIVNNKLILTFCQMDNLHAYYIIYFIASFRLEVDVQTKVAKLKSRKPCNKLKT